MKFILCKTYDEVTEKAAEIIANEALDYEYRLLSPTGEEIASGKGSTFAHPSF